MGEVKITFQSIFIIFINTTLSYFLKSSTKLLRLGYHQSFYFQIYKSLDFLTYNSFKFKDSLEYLPSSLSKLVTELNNPYQNHNFPIFHQSKIIQSFLQKKNESKENIKMKLKLLTNGKG